MKHHINGYQIETEYVHPPIPMPQFDWQATLDGYEPGDKIGNGATEKEAIEDLLWRLQ
jgi:hypothetical protein